MFDKFKSGIPTNEKLCVSAAEKILFGKTEPEIKRNFSKLFDLMQEEIYQRYLEAEKTSGQFVVNEEIATYGGVDFSELNSFFLSISQSRKSRAGSAFEYIIKELFSRLSYPFSSQVNIDGAKPDFVMPSEAYFREKPLDSIIFTAKRTLRERWRQVVTEANKGYGFYLATLDDKIAENQISHAATHKIFLVVPESVKSENKAYRESYNILSFEEFFEDHLDPAMKRWKKAGF